MPIIRTQRQSRGNVGSTRPSVATPEEGFRAALESLEALAPPHPRCGTGRLRVVVLGAGYGGITAALRLARRLKGCARSGGAAELVLVDRHSYHLLKTRLHEAAVSGEEVAVSIPDLIRPLHLRFVRGEMWEIVLLEAGERLLPGAGPLLSRWATAQLRRRGVDIRCPAQLTGAEAGVAHLAPYRPRVRGDAYSMERYLGLTSLVLARNGRGRVSGVVARLLKNRPATKHPPRLRGERVWWLLDAPLGASADVPAAGA